VRVLPSTGIRKAEGAADKRILGYFLALVRSSTAIHSSLFAENNFSRCSLVKGISTAKTPLVKILLLITIAAGNKAVVVVSLA
jgi:hypothetical protein